MILYLYIYIYYTHSVFGIKNRFLLCKLMSENDDAYTYRLAVYSPYHLALKSVPNNIMLFGARL